MATHTPVNDRLVIHTKQAAYRSYVIGLAVPAWGVPKVLLWDTGDPCHYVRHAAAKADGPATASAQEILIIGGEGHQAGRPTTLTCGMRGWSNGLASDFRWWTAPPTRTFRWSRRLRADFHLIIFGWVKAPLGKGRSGDILQPMNPILLILVLLLLFGGGGFYLGGPVIGGSGLGLVLLICLIVFLFGGFRSTKS